MLTPEAFETEAGAAFRRVFASTDPFGEPFTSRIERREIVLWGGYSLDGALLPLATAARNLGDGGCYVTCTERVNEVAPPYRAVPQDWYVGFDDLGAYPSDWLFVENATFSPRGRWGILVSHESHLVVGGPAEFVDEFVDSLLPVDPMYDAAGQPRAPVPARDSVTWWLEYMSHRNALESYDWLPRLLQHVYGREWEKVLARAPRRAR